MREYIENYHKKFINLIDSIEFTDNQGTQLDTFEGIETICDIVKRQSDMAGKIISIGNGGSSVIASHMAIDFWKNAQIPAIAFNDGALLTCISNDFGYECVFQKPIEFFAKADDVLFAISSSGKSENILRGVQAAQSQGCTVITLSGFDADNPLRSMGNWNFYVPSHEYGCVEVIHQYICHYILDIIIHEKTLVESVLQVS